MLLINVGSSVQVHFASSISIHQMLLINEATGKKVRRNNFNFNTSNVINQQVVKVKAGTIKRFQYIKCY